MLDSFRSSAVLLLLLQQPLLLLSQHVSKDQFGSNLTGGNKVRVQRLFLLHIMWFSDGKREMFIGLLVCPGLDGS